LRGRSDVLSKSRDTRNIISVGGKSGVSTQFSLLGCDQVDGPGRGGNRRAWATKIGDSATTIDVADDAESGETKVDDENGVTNRGDASNA
jgi:hypothetical protein